MHPASCLRLSCKNEINSGEKRRKRKTKKTRKQKERKRRKESGNENLCLKEVTVQCLQSLKLAVLLLKWPKTFDPFPVVQPEDFLRQTRSNEKT